MSKDIKQNFSLKLTVIISVILHIILFTVIVFSVPYNYIDISIDKNNSSYIKSLVVNSDFVVQYYNLGGQQKTKDIKYFKEKKDEQKQKCQSKIQKNIKLDMNSIKFNINSQIDNVAEIAKKTLQDSTKKTVQDSNKKTVQDSTKKDVIKKSYVYDVNDLVHDSSKYNNLIKNGDKIETNHVPLIKGSNFFNKNFLLSRDINKYAMQIQSAIESSFYDASSYAGKICILYIKLAPNGILIDIKSKGGDIALCKAALAATRRAKIPKPPSVEIYKIFKNASLEFKP